MRPAIALVALLSLHSTNRLTGQAPADAAPALTVTARFPTDRFIDGTTTLELELSRAPRPGERIAVVIGSTDVSGLLEVGRTRVRYRPGATRLPAGEREVAVYAVEGDRWTPAGRFPIKVRTRLGLDRQRLLPNVDLSSTGQLGGGGSGAAAAGSRGAHQDVTVRIGVESAVGRDGAEITTVANLVGVSEESQRLRFGEMGSRAPIVDLADYRVTVARRGISVAAGHLSTGSHRHLLSGFASRGLGGSARLGRVATLEAALLNGTSVIGWSNLLGLTVPDHRIGAANLVLELQPRRPGSFRFDLSGMEGAVQPLTGVSQGAVADAEESRGWGGQLAWSDPRQRVQLSAGIARSRFVNPDDPSLGTGLVATVRTTRTARFGNLAVRLLDGIRLGKDVRAAVAANLRHERVDPLYRSLGASTQADLESNGFELDGAIGALAVQVGFGGVRDNLARIASILTTRTSTRTDAVALPLGALFRRSGRWEFPQVAYQRQTTHQRGEGIPVGGEFSASHVPDQTSVSQTGSLSWSRRGTQLAYRWSQSFQDNRQTGRERADFRGIVHGISLGLSGSDAVAVQLDGSVERQKSFEQSATQRLERVGVSVRWRATRATELGGTLAQSWSVDPGAGVRSRNTESQLEASHGFDLYRRSESGKQARLFVRFGRTRAARYPFAPAVAGFPEIQWTLHAGGSIRLY